MHANEEEWGVHHEKPQRTVWIEGQGYVAPTRTADTTRQEALIRALTEEQKAAVTHPPGRSVLVRAGAGTGKTRVLTHRIAWLIAGGVEPRRVLAVTFTRKAAREMRERVDGLIGERSEGQARGCQIGTYHGLSARLLRRVAGATARLTGRRLDDGFSILSDTGQIDAMKQAATQVIGPHNEIEADEAKRDGNAVPKPRKIARRSVKDLLDAMDLWTRDAPTLNALVEELRTQEMTVSFDRGQKIDAIDRPAADVLDAYIEWKNDNNCVDYADLIGLTVLTMEEEPELAGDIEQVLADEFQDTDVLQERWLKAVMSARNAPLFAVGDANQLIYQWRGANPSQITTLPQRWNTDALNLTVNFRSPPKVLGLANATLERNEVRVKTQWLRPCEARAQEQDAVVRLRRFLNSREEAAWICDHIQNSIAKGMSPDRIAILARLKRAWIALESFMGRARIPYRVIAGRRFAERAEIRDIAAWLRFVMNRSDGVACEHVLVKRKTGFGETSMRKAREWAEHQGVSVGSVLHELAAGAEHHGRKVLTGKAVETAREVAEAADRIGAMMNRGTRPEQMLEEVLTLSGVEAQAKRMAAQSDEEKASAGRAQLDRLNELRAIAAECPSIIELSDHLAISDLPADGEERAAVTLSTVHGFKGAECDHVLLMGMEEDILPKAGVESAPEQIEEERRIFHVAVTRACRTLTLTCAMERNEVQTEPSRFIDEVAQHVMVVSQSKPRLPFRANADKR